MKDKDYSECYHFFDDICDLTNDLCKKNFCKDKQLAIIQENTALKLRIEELKTSFENERQNLHTKNKALTNDKVEALKQKLEKIVQIIERED